MQRLTLAVVFVFIYFLSHTQSINYTLDLNQEFQSIDGFGASDAWRCQFVGANWPADKKEQIAKWLFSTDTDKNGNPEGIGLSMWRFYIGAGSAEQGNQSGIKNEWRRAESFLDNSENFNFDSHEGQKWFLHKAKAYGVEKFLAFSISAPVNMTLNRKAYAEKGINRLNLKDSHYPAFSEYLVSTLKAFKEEGIEFDYLSPVNEPQWDWEKATQEGTPASNHDIYRLVELLDQDLAKTSLETKIIVAETADLRFIYKEHGKPNRADQADHFFSENHAFSLKEFSKVENTVSGHSYFTTWPVDTLIQIRRELKRKLEELDLDYWQSEFCILESNEDIEGGWKRDLGMNTALYVARVIHADLTLADAKSWQWWTALTIADYKDGLIYLDTGIEGDLFNHEKLQEDGQFHDSKLLWALGNYSRFVRPGMKRIAVSSDRIISLHDEYHDLMLSAYKSPENKEVVLVAINYSDSEKIFNLMNKNIILESAYTTSPLKNLVHSDLYSNSVKIGARSIVTLIATVTE